jgi:hypothetical protein
MLDSVDASEAFYLHGAAVEDARSFLRAVRERIIDL